MANTAEKHEDLPKSEPPVAGCSNQSNILCYPSMHSFSIAFPYQFKHQKRWWAHAEGWDCTSNSKCFSEIKPSFSRFGESLCSCPLLGHRSALHRKGPSSLEYTSPSLVPWQGSGQSPSHGFRFFIVKTVSDSNCLKQHPSVSKHQASPLQRRGNGRCYSVFSKRQQQLDSCLARAAVTLSWWW